MTQPTAQYIEQPTTKQFEDFVKIAQQSFILSREHVVLRLPPGAVRLISSDDHVAGGLLILDDAQRFGGREVRTWLIGMVAVAAPYRGRCRGLNIGRSLMQNALNEAYAAGVALSSLYVTTASFYRRFGYEVAGQSIYWQAPLHKLPTERTDAIIEPVDVNNPTAELAAYAAATVDANGPLALRHPELLRRVFQADHVEMQPYRIRFNDSVEGYIIPELKHADDNLRISRQVAVTPRAAQAALTFCAEYRTQFQSVIWSGGPADPMRMLISANAKMQNNTEWFLRIVHVEAALSQRGYAKVDLELHLDITDDLLPQNASRYILTIRNGQATVERGGTGSIALDVRTLAPIYSSYLCPFDLHRVGLITASREDLAALALAFSGPQPYLLDRF